MKSSAHCFETPWYRYTFKNWLTKWLKSVHFKFIYFAENKTYSSIIQTMFASFTETVICLHHRQKLPRNNVKRLFFKSVINVNENHGWLFVAVTSSWRLNRMNAFNDKTDLFCWTNFLFYRKLFSMHICYTHAESSFFALATSDKLFMLLSKLFARVNW